MSKIHKFFRATLAREACNRLNYWREAAREAAREARRLAPVISSRRIWYIFWTNMCPGVAGVGELRSPKLLPLKMYFLARFDRPKRAHYVPFPDQTGSPNKAEGPKYILIGCPG